ncbi:Cof-type HAD-IIB family hydrolase [uncultured Ilumatobacter sp.]|uniref:Cof-type HAD-IIB family hydrolase n=1 Tax=uncultured Ilumatobacter sp. TaxID=879968 RepID=UPI00374E4C8C
MTKSDVRLIACDLDGTLFGPDHLLSQRTIAAVQHAVAAGIHVVAATGRSTTSAVPRLGPAEVITTAVCSNGSLIHDMLSSETIRFPIDPAHVNRFFAALTAIDDRYAFCWETDHGNGWDESFGDIAAIHEDLGDVPGLATRPTGEHHTTKLMVRHPEITQEALRDNLVPLLVDPLTVSTSGVQFVEVTGEGITKASALAHLCTDWGIDPAQVIAFGDNHNDAAMLTWAGHGVAMGNASIFATEAADEVIGTNAENAVAVFIESLLARN